MTIYNFNLLVGYVSTGVDYAQAYRAQMLRGICDQKFVFLEVPQHRELEYYNRIGIREEEILVLPFWFVNAQNIYPSLTFDKVKEKVLSDDSEYEFIEEEGKRRFCRADQGKSIIFYLTEQGYVYLVEYYFQNTLIRKDHYSDRLLFTEYLKPIISKLNAFVKTFQIDYYNEEGVIGLQEFRTKEGSIYAFPDLAGLTSLELLEYFVRLNRFSDDDVLLLDRINPHFPVLMKYKGNARMVFFMHSKLTFADYSDSHHWKGVNYEYTDLVRNADRFDAILTSTQEQADEVREWFLKEYGRRVKTYAIPVGGMRDLTGPADNRKKHGLVSVSRLDHRKRIDLLIKAVAKARESIPDLTLDIFGEGPEKKRYEDLIAEYGARDYICLKGYVRNFNGYAMYEGYISASLWETFGLTLLEAMSGGLALIGLDVPYGNRCMIHDGQNGFIVPFKDGQPDEVTVKGLADAIIKLLKNDDLSRFSSCSYQEAVKYSPQDIRKKWIQMLNETGAGNIDHITG